MAETLQKKAFHALLALCLTAGVLMPILSALYPHHFSWTPLLYSFLLVIALELLSLRRWTALAGAGLALALLAAWLLAGDGIPRLSDVLIAVSLRFRGQEAALPLVREDLTLLLTLLIPLLCWLATLRSVSWMPALVLCVGIMLMLWLGNFPHLIPWLLPALAVFLWMLILDRHASTSPVRVFPWLAAVTALAFLLAPKGGQTWEPLKEKADEFRQAVLDRLFFTEPRDVFSLSSEGYYPEGSGQLGGKPELSDHPVMQVSTPRLTYLRGVILNEYNGRAWRNTLGGRRYLWQSRTLSAERQRLFDENLPQLSTENALLSPQAVSVRFLSDSASTLFTPQRVRQLNPGGDLVPYFSNASEIFITRNLQPGDTYAVSAPLVMAGDPGIGTLVEAASAFSDPAWESNQEIYTALPTHLEQPLYDLAGDIASAGTTAYEKAFALQSWLSRNCRYTLDVEDHPANVDFVTRFVLETREGYCTYFASALTVLCRMVGLPARYVEGYLAVPGDSGEALVTSLNAHAWTEVYFKSFGWLTFDATPRQQDPEKEDGPEENPSPAPEATPTPPPPEETPEPTPPEEEASPEGAEDPTPEPTPEPEPEPDPADPQTELPPPDEPESRSLLWLWLLLLLLLLALLALRICLTSPARHEKKARTEAERFSVWAREITSLLTAAKWIRQPGETLMSFTCRLDNTGNFTVDLAPVGECLSLMGYSKTLPVPSDTALLKDTARILHKELTTTGKLRYWLRRIFLPHRSHRAD